MRQWLIKKLRGFPDLDSAIQAIKDTDDLTRKHVILTEAVKKLFNTIGPEDILKLEQDVWTFEGKPLTRMEMTNLRQEAEFLRRSKLWRVLKLDIRYQLNKKMYEEGRTELDVVWGKLALYLDDIARARLKSLESL